MDYVVGQVAGWQLAEVMEAKLAHEERLLWAKAFYDLGVLHGHVLKMNAAVEEVAGIIKRFQEVAASESGLTLPDAMFLEGLEEVLGEHDGDDS